MFRNKALWLGSEANERAEAGDYYGAIELFSKAIGMCPGDYRFYLNRAFCYEKIELYHWSLADSEEAIRLNRFIEKCYLRKARALVGLKEYTKAEQTYQSVLLMNPDSVEADGDLIELRFRALIDMGFDRQSAISGAKVHQTIRSAIDGLLSHSIKNCYKDFDKCFSNKSEETDETINSFVDNNNESIFSSNDSQIMVNKIDDKNEMIPSNEVQYTDEDSHQSTNNVLTVKTDNNADKVANWAEIVAKTPFNTQNSMTKVVETRTAKKLVKPTNIWGYNGVRVEKVNVDNKKAITELFASFGKVIGVEPVTNRKNSIWIYYDNPNAAIEAIAGNQSTIHPNINYYSKGQTEPLRIYFAATNDQKDLKFCRPKHPANDRGECYYWRTTTCLMENCRLSHVPENRHIDAQIWMKDMEGHPI